MFTAQYAKQKVHYTKDARFVLIMGLINQLQRVEDERILNLANARVPRPDMAAIGAFLMQRSELIFLQWQLLSDALELEDMPGTYYYTGSTDAASTLLAKSDVIPSTWVANRFDLGFVSPKLCHIWIYYRPQHEELFYKHLGMAYLTSNDAVKGACKQNMLHDFNYKSDIFSYHYDTAAFNHVRYHGYIANPLTDEAANKIHGHRLLLAQAYGATLQLREMNEMGGNKNLLFNGAGIYPYPGKHPYSTCAQRFDLSRVDPDAKDVFIYFFPAHEKVLYGDYGFAFLVSDKVTMPGARRADIIRQHGTKIFANFFAHQVGLHYNIQYTHRSYLEWYQVEYDWSVEKAKLDANWYWKCVSECFNARSGVWW